MDLNPRIQYVRGTMCTLLRNLSKIWQHIRVFVVSLARFHISPLAYVSQLFSQWRPFIIKLHICTSKFFIELPPPLLCPLASSSISHPIIPWSAPKTGEIRHIKNTKEKSLKNTFFEILFQSVSKVFQKIFKNSGKSKNPHSKTR